jgi:hypothetical protein
LCVVSCELYVVCSLSTRITTNTVLDTVENLDSKPLGFMSQKHLD